MLRDSTVVVAAVVRTRPRALPLARITMRKSVHAGFPSVFYMGMGLRLAALRADGAPLKIARLDNTFLEVSLTASKPSRRSVTAAKRKENQRKERRKKN